MRALDSRDPSYVRMMMQTSYDRYRSGEDMFPRLRFTVDPEEFPRKSRQAARLLFRAHQIIDEDKSMFQDSMLSFVKDMRNGTVDIAPGTARAVITRVGRNAVHFGTLTAGEMVTPLRRDVSASVGVFPRAEFVEQFEGTEIKVGDDCTVTLRNGQMEVDGGAIDLAIVRQSNVSMLIGSV